jgi:hypothetical protein
MNQATGKESRRTVGRVLGGASAALLFAVAIIQPQAVSADGGGGGFHSRGGAFHGGRLHQRSGQFRPVFGFGGIYSPFWWGYGFPFPFYDYGDYPDHRNYGYDPGSSYYGDRSDYGYRSQPNDKQTWYHCSDPVGYYPSVTHCNTVWEYGPGSAMDRDRATPPHRSHVATQPKAPRRACGNCSRSDSGRPS